MTLAKAFKTYGVLLPLLFSCLGSQAALAQDNGLSTRLMRPKVRYSRNHFHLDMVPIALKGVGLSYERDLTKRWGVGPYVSYFRLEENGDSFFAPAYRSDLLLAGVRTRFFVTGNTNTHGFYLQGGLGAVRNKSEVNFMALGGPGNAEQTSIGYLAGLGYQIGGWEMGAATRFAVNLGAGWGSGYAVQYSARSSLSGTNLWIENKDSLYLEASLALIL